MLLLNYAGYIEPIFTYDKDETLIYLYKFDTIYTFYVTGLYTQNNVPDSFVSAKMALYYCNCQTYTI